MFMFTLNGVGAFKRNQRYHVCCVHKANNLPVLAFAPMQRIIAQHIMKGVIALLANAQHIMKGVTAQHIMKGVIALLANAQHIMKGVNAQHVMKGVIALLANAQHIMKGVIAQRIMKGRSVVHKANNLHSYILNRTGMTILRSSCLLHHTISIKIIH